MQAVDMKRFRVTRIGIALAAIGVLSAGVVGLEAIDDIASDGGASAISPSIGQVLTVEDMLFLEANTILPEAAPALTRGIEEILFLEMNTYLPGDDGLTRESSLVGGGDTGI